ncbi:autotransporter outer membrane beta-barrel domain-containing protein [Legionella lytica]|uniref:Autotransporter outer membrane beta-barrel domain-containing protein n=1 Tax=Legionella lytica TaxID=96232 RepID=A0ABW8DA78_9GAMM
MKKQAVILSLFLLGSGQIVCADALSRTRSEMATETNSNVTGFLKKITPEFLYGYTDFHFESSSSENINRYNGHSNLYSAGADHLSFGPSVMAGVYYFRVDTSINSAFLLSPSPVTTTSQNIKNDTIFGHVLKIFTPQIYLDLAAGYGQNKINSYLTVAPDTLDESHAYARNGSDNWFVSANGIYRKSWQKFLLRANFGVLYSQIDTGPYTYKFPALETSVPIEALRNKATLLMENAELGYFINPKLMPFINGGLFQVAQFSNSRPIVNSAITVNGTLPQLNMNKDGFRLGGGVSYTHKNVTMRVEEKYYNASSTFHSFQTLAAIEYQFS